MDQQDRTTFRTVHRHPHCIRKDLQAHDTQWAIPLLQTNFSLGYQGNIRIDAEILKVTIIGVAQNETYLGASSYV